MPRTLPAVLLLALCFACGGSGEPTASPGAGATSAATSTAATATAKVAASGDCSAAEPTKDSPEKQGIPDDVADTRSTIIQAAIRCDYDELEDVALEGSDSFNYSFGEPTDPDEARPGRYWNEREDDDEPVLATLVRVLRFRPGRTSADGEDLYVWPAAAAGDEPSEKDREAVEDAFKDENVDEWFTDGGYLGPRAGINANGDWIFYVTGGD